MEKVHIITGGSSGIGLECAKQFKDGIVLISSRGEDKLKAAQIDLKKEGIDVVYKSSDLTDKDSLKELFDYAKSLGKIKTVVNSAGVSGTSGNAKLTFEIDLIGTQNLIKESLKIADKNTAVILIASMMGTVVPDSKDYNKYLEDPSSEGAIDALVKIVDNNADVAYNYSKKGVQLLAKKYAPEFGEKGARIVSVSPGIIMSPMVENAAKEHLERINHMKAMTPAGRIGKPEDIAHTVAFLADDKASFITGSDILVDGGLSINLPKIQEAYSK